MSLPAIFRAAAAVTDVPYDDLIATYRVDKVRARPRQYAMFVAVKYGYSTADLAEFLQRDATTVLYGLRQIGRIAERSTEKALIAAIEDEALRWGARRKETTAAAAQPAYVSDIRRYRDKGFGVRSIARFLDLPVEIVATECGVPWGTPGNG